MIFKWLIIYGLFSVYYEIVFKLQKGNGYLDIITEDPNK